MAENNVLWDLESLARVVAFCDIFADEFNKFLTTGVESMQNSGIKGGDQEKKIKEACDVILEKKKIIDAAIKENAADIKTLIKDGEGFDEQDLMKKASEIAENAKKTDAVGVISVF